MLEWSRRVRRIGDEIERVVSLGVDGQHAHQVEPWEPRQDFGFHSAVGGSPQNGEQGNNLLT